MTNSGKMIFSRMAHLAGHLTLPRKPIVAKEPRMATAELPLPAEGTMAQIIAYLGDIPPERIRLRPGPGKATEEDLILVNERRDRLCELIDGVLVEKPMGFYESRLAVILIYFLETYLRKNDL